MVGVGLAAKVLSNFHLSQARNQPRLFDNIRPAGMLNVGRIFDQAKAAQQESHLIAGHDNKHTNHHSNKNSRNHNDDHIVRTKLLVIFAPKN